MDVTPQAAVSAITASRVKASLSLGRTPIGATGSNDLLGHLRNSHGRFQCGDPAENRARCRSADRRDGANIASLTASGPGALLYGDLGFKDYCRFREYVWRPSPSHQATKPRALDSGH